MIKISDTAKSRIAQLMTDEGFNVAKDFSKLLSAIFNTLFKSCDQFTQNSDDGRIKTVIIVLHLINFQSLEKAI